MAAGSVLDPFGRRGHARRVLQKRSGPLVVNGAETPAFTLATNPPPPIVGSAEAIRARCAQLTAAALPTGQPANAQQAGLPPDADRPGRRSDQPRGRRLRPVPPTVDS
jgi:hypothetical protein